MASIHPDIKSILISENEIEGIVERLGAQITRDYKGKSVLVVCILKGAFVFMSDLVRRIDLPCKIEFMTVSSYGASTMSSGMVNIVQDVRTNIKDKHVIIAEDILDTGLTLSKVVEVFKQRKPASVEIVAFAVKDLPGVTHHIEPKYVGTHVPNEFIVGYGLDYAEEYRNLPYIGVLKPSVYA